MTYAVAGQEGTCLPERFPSTMGAAWFSERKCLYQSILTFFKAGKLYNTEPPITANKGFSDIMAPEKSRTPTQALLENLI